MGSWEKEPSLSLSFDEVARYFSVPIAEAANILGVCSSVLKKICRDNGIPRWPYRKFLAGKTVEEIKREAVREKEAIEDLKKTSNENNKILLSNGTPSLSTASVQTLEPKAGTTSTQLESKSNITVNDTVKWQLGFSTAGQIAQACGTKIPQAVRQHPYQMGHRAAMVTYLDEFKQGFPKSGLSSVSNRWWGSSESLSTNNPHEGLQRSEMMSAGKVSDTSEGSEGGPIIQVKSELDFEMDAFSEEKNESFGGETISNVLGNMRPHDEDLMPVTVLSRTRKKNAEDGRKILKLAVTNGYGTYKVEEKDNLLLKQIFGFPLPGQWNASLS